MILKALPYLTAPSGTKVDKNGAVPNVTDTGMKITVWFCASCESMILPLGARPQFEQ